MYRKSIVTEAVSKEMNNEGTINFFQNIICSKSIKFEAVCTKTELNNEWNINFLQNSLLGISYSSEYSIDWSTAETLLIWNYFSVFLLMFSTTSNFTIVVNFMFRKHEKVAQWVCIALTHYCVLLKTADQQSIKSIITCILLQRN